LDSSMTGFSPPMAQDPRAINDPYPKMARNIFYKEIAISRLSLIG
jgi:hypothetical protein